MACVAWRNICTVRRSIILVGANNQLFIILLFSYMPFFEYIDFITYIYCGSVMGYDYANLIFSQVFNRCVKFFFQFNKNIRAMASKAEAIPPTILLIIFVKQPLTA